MIFTTNNRGITLIEIIMVIMILAILSAATLMRMESYNAVKVDGMTTRLIASIRYVQQLAISSQKNMGISFVSKSYFVDPNLNGSLTKISYDMVNVEPNLAPPINERLEFNPWGIPYYKPNGGSLNPLNSPLLIKISFGITEKRISISPHTGHTVMVD